MTIFPYLSRKSPNKSRRSPRTSCCLGDLSGKLRVWGVRSPAPLQSKGDRHVKSTVVAGALVPLNNGEQT
jgi:hypothetical protein